MVHTNLNLVVGIGLQVLQISVHIIEIIRHALSRGDKSSLRSVTAGVLGDLL